MQFAALSALLCTVAPIALAQQAAEPGSDRSSGEPAATKQTEGVIVFPPSFFAAARPNTAFDMIQRLPGFTFNPGDAGVRGFAGAAGNVLIDGQRPASKSESLQEVLFRIPASQVARIELIRGGTAGIQMQGQTVLANVVRQASASTQHIVSGSPTLAADGDFIPTLRYEFIRQAGERAYDFQATVTGGIDDGAGDGTRARFSSIGDEIERARLDSNGIAHQYEAKAGFRLPFAGGKLRTNATVRRATYEFEQDLRRPSGAELTDFISDGWNGEAGANFDRKLGPRTNFEAVLLQRFDQDEIISRQAAGANATVFSADALSGESIARTVLRFNWSEGLTFEGGGEGAFNFLDSQTKFEINGLPVVLPSASVRVEERRGEGFAQGAWRPANGVSIEAGSRFEVSTISQTGDVELERSFFYSKPRMLLTWSPNPAHQIRLRAQREVGQLDFGDFVSSAELQNELINVGNPELEPDKTWVLEGAFERRFWGKGASVLTVRHREISDVVDLVPILGPGFAFDAPGNIGDGRSDELQLTLALPLDRLGVTNGLLKTDGTWRVSEVTDPTTGDQRRISGQRPYDVTVSFTQDVAHLKTTWGFDSILGFRQASYRISEIRRTRVTPILSLFADYKPTPKLSVRASLTNVTPFEVFQQREVYSGPRGTAPILFVQNTELRSYPKAQVRLRHVFGG